ncbi:MAG: uracil-DNA glycosylase [Burkholderiaceae bacterium]|jgi:DNA polymerase|nr:uracil-DNA glycosylase [Burkholderiaceae bacterium]
MTLDARRSALWHAMGLGPLWQSRAAAQGAAEPVAAGQAGVIAVAEPAPQLPSIAAQTLAVADEGLAPLARVAANRDVATLGWAELEETVAGCTACGLCRSRKQTVFGVGHVQADWMLIGEAPGAEEDARGEPFVGQAGQLLDNMLASVGLSRSGEDPRRTVYIANVLKCRPPGNRNPEPAEVAQCEPYLRRQLALVQPQLVLVMGRFAAQSMLGTEASIASLRGRVHQVRVDGREVPVIVTYHPAYLLRNLADKAKSWADLCLAKAVAERAT